MGRRRGLGRGASWPSSSARRATTRSCGVLPRRTRSSAIPSGILLGVGGNDRIFGLANTADELERISGDALTIGPAGRGGNDVIQGGDGDDTIYGDASGSLFGIGGNDVIYQNGGSEFIHGDARKLETGSRGGNDRLYGTGTLIGDSNDEMISADGGDDLLDASGATARSTLMGESYYQMGGSSQGGDDVLKGSAFDDRMNGDADNNLIGQARGGNDRILGNGGDDELMGDAQNMRDTAVGGDDILRGGAGSDTIRGDARFLSDFAQGGDDRLHSGGGDDEIWGDGGLFDDAEGGADKFHFNGNFGDDRVLDFRQEDGDQLVFKGLTQSEVQITIVTVNDPDDSTLITTLGDESVTLVGFTGGLTVGSDILFA